MGLKNRDGRSYYYRTHRDGKKVRKLYVGAGELAYIASQLDEAKRRKREQEAACFRETQERLEREAAFLGELEEVTKILTRAHLIAAGYHKRRGEWRRERE